MAIIFGGPMRQIERAFQRLIFGSRWLAAPFLLGLIAGLVLLLYRFFADLLVLAIRVPAEGWHDLIVGILNLVDITLTANLILIVIFSGYDNFIHKIDVEEHAYLPAGLVDVDFSALKQKLLGSIAAIAAVDALAWYLDLQGTTDATKLIWAVGFPLMFVGALLMLAIADRLGRKNNEAE
jgi:uncharacterized protein (TIGR00645 family)